GGILGAMMLAVGVELLKFGRDLPHDRRLATVLVTIVMSVVLNMVWGFAGGVLVHRQLESSRTGRKG
ncbi:MAG: hypothetical protein ACP5DY_08820, partial [Thermovirgaceae bacterium]